MYYSSFIIFHFSLLYLFPQNKCQGLHFTSPSSTILLFLKSTTTTTSNPTHIERDLWCIYLSYQTSCFGKSFFIWLSHVVLKIKWKNSTVQIYPCHKYMQMLVYISKVFYLDTPR